jgi:predicted lipoprotein with Yx(FWY)xxD motif
MKPRLLALLLTMILGAGAIAGVSVVPATAKGTAMTPTIKLVKTSKGKLLSSRGFVLYRFSHDKGTKNTCVKIKGCKRTWPALTTVGRPHAGPGVKASLLGTTRLPNGKKQVTYAGHALYKYAFGTKGSASYVGFFEFGGYWYGVSAAGKTVK